MKIINIKKLVSILVLIWVFFIFAGCTPQSTQIIQPTNTKLRVLLIITNLGDNGFNDNAWLGLQSAKKDFGTTISVREIGDTNSGLDVCLESESESKKYDVICVSSLEGGTAADWLEQNALRFPNIKYIFYDAPQSLDIAHPNVQYITFNQSQGDYLAGALSAMITQSDVVAFIGGKNQPVIDEFLIGFLSGVKATDPSVKVYIDYIGNWSDKDIGYKLAQQAAEKGADVMHAVAGGAGEGVLQYCSENNIPFIGVDNDQYLIFKETNSAYSDVIATSVLKNCGIALYNTISYVGQDIFVQGRVVYNLTNKGVGLAQNENYNKMIDDSIKSKIHHIETQILEGSTYIPSASQSRTILDQLIEELKINTEN